MGSKFLKFAINLILKAKLILQSVISKKIISAVNPILKNYTSYASKNILTIQIPNTKNSYQIFYKFSSVPMFTKVNNDDIFNLNLEISFKNNLTNETCHYKNNKNFPSIKSNSSNIGIRLGNNLLSEIVWISMNSKMINLTLSNSQLPKNLPISLTTTGIAIILPQLSKVLKIIIF